MVKMKTQQLVPGLACAPDKRTLFVGAPLHVCEGGVALPGRAPRVPWPEGMLCPGQFSAPWD